MLSRFVNLDPDTIAMLDRCMTKAQQVAAELETEENSTDMRARLASALIEAAGHGEKDEAQLLEFALRVLPNYRERRSGH